MKYRLHFEPMDFEAKDVQDAIKQFFLDVKPPISKILPIDKDGFVIEGKRD